QGATHMRRASPPPRAVTWPPRRRLSPRRSIASVLGPFLESARVMPDVRVAQAPQQADRLLAERSRGATAIGNDGGGSIRKQLWRPPRDLGHWQIDRAGYVKGRERLGG